MIEFKNYVIFGEFILLGKWLEPIHLVKNGVVAATQMDDISNQIQTDQYDYFFFIFKSFIIQCFS